MKNKLLLAGSLCSLTVPIAQAAKVEKQNQSKPNVVFIIADDLGYGDLSCYGQEKFDTPNIDKLALQGMRFTQCYSGTTVSAPSRSSLITGMHTGHTPVRGNHEVKPEGQYPIPENSNTLFKLFKEAGYNTGAFGKWGLGSPGSVGDPNNQFVDEFFGYNCQLLAHNYYPDHLWHNQERIELPGNYNGGFGTYSQDLIHEQCMKFIDKQDANTPFFLFVPTILPHAELIVPEDSIIQKLRGKYPEKAYRGTDSGPAFRKGGYCSQEHPRATFAAMITRLDVYVGQIVEALKEKGLYDNTLIVFTSDNGPHQEGGADPDFFNSNGVFRGYKRDLYEGGIRVPFIASWNNKIEAGTASDLLFAFWDIVPTFSQILGNKNKKSCGDGLSILPTLTNKGKQKEHDYLYFEFQEMGGRQAIRSGNWKLIRQNIRKNGGYYELYNVASDPSEKWNVINKYPEIAESLKNKMDNSHVEDPNWPLLERIGK